MRMDFWKKSSSEMQELNINHIYFSVLWACFICWENLRTIYLFSSSIKLQNIKCVGLSAMFFCLLLLTCKVKYFLNCLDTIPQNVIISDNCLPFFILYHYFLSSSTINCVNLRSDPEFKLCALVHNAYPLMPLKISRKKLVRVYNAHGLLKKIVVGNARIKYQSYIFFSS
jgi:hypothetical protein